YQQKLPEAYPGTKVIKKRSILYYYYLATSQYWINNQNFPTWVKKRKGQTYIQTWHGTPLKRMLHDLNQVYGRKEGYKDRVSQAINQWDYLISPSTYATRCFQSAFHYQKEILQVGYPRNDIFFQPDDVKEPLIQLARRRLSLPSDKKVILYAPTFRDHEVDDNNRFVFQLNLDLEALYQALHDEYVILIRLHVIISNKITIPKKYEHFIINASQYPDITDLYLLSDICITDYSSVMFDYANSHRPMLFYAYDLAYYRDTLRGFYLDYETQLPGPIVRTTQEWIDEVKKIDQYDAVYGDKYQTFIQTYCGDEHGTASQQIIDRFFTKHETH
ncbi:MAG: CDP-glycerol glycerophosphotransferase family protein, partial [Erysipelotrichaceae bacterium]